MLRNLTLKDKEIFDRFLGYSAHELSVYFFASLYVWRRLYDIRWKVFDDNLCVFFEDTTGCFACLPPLGKRFSLQAVQECFKVMGRRNRNPAVSRIENVESADTGRYRQAGYELFEKSHDYLCSRREMVQLRGDRYKSKRSCVNFFVKNHSFQLKRYNRSSKEDCLALYRTWKGQRLRVSADAVFRGMLDDSFQAFEEMLNGYEQLGIQSMLVLADGRPAACTFGYELNPSVFCVWYEIADLAVKGVAQFIFQQFCAASGSYEYINIMDDSGLANLAAVKQSYRPVKLVTSYNVVCRHETPS